MKKSEVYELLQDKMLTYTELLDVLVFPNGEPLVPLNETDNLSVNPVDPKMAEVTGNDIYVRQGVVERLGMASMALAKNNPELKLEVVYGYRLPSIQKQNFARVKEELPATLEGIELMEAAHRMVAVPKVAGHPTGGAVDVQLTKEGEPLDFGTKQREFVPDTYTFSPFIGRPAWSNRQLLRRIMLGAGFAPFDGEWWHFSYGDREWAKYYNEPNAIYEQIEFSAR